MAELCSLAAVFASAIAASRSAGPAISVCRHGDPELFGIAMRVYARSSLTEARPVHNLVVSNVPGPQIPLYFLGAEVTALYPLGPIFHGAGLNITVMSLNGKLNVGLISCPALLPDLWDMADGFSTGMKELVAACKPTARRR